MCTFGSDLCIRAAVLLDDCRIERKQDPVKQRLESMVYTGNGLNGEYSMCAKHDSPCTIPGTSPQASESAGGPETTDLQEHKLR